LGNGKFYLFLFLKEKIKLLLIKHFCWIRYISYEEMDVIICFGNYKVL